MIVPGQIGLSVDLLGERITHRAWIALAFFCLFISGCAAENFGRSPTATAPDGPLEIARARLLKPEGPGPFPAVVIMHDCSGLGPRSSGAPIRWGKELVESGYVILVPDSFTTRGHADGVCADSSPSRNDVAPARRAFDAYAALDYLRSLSFVDGSRIGILGGSHGGTTTLFTMAASERENEPLAQDKRMGFSAAIALYPSCGVQVSGWSPVRRARGSGSITNYVGVYKPVAPLMILIGENDDWSPAEPCRKLVDAARQAGFPVSIKIYPGANHAFDSNFPVRYDPARVNANSPTGLGATTGGDPEAWDDSKRQVKKFFQQYLKRAAN